MNNMTEEDQNTGGSGSGDGEMVVNYSTSNHNNCTVVPAEINKETDMAKLNKPDSESESSVHDNSTAQSEPTNDIPSDKVHSGVSTMVNSKRGLKELLSLGVTDFENDDDDKHDVFIDENNEIYKKYRLRDAVNRPDYRIPTVNDLPKLEFEATVIKQEKTICQECSIEFCSQFELSTHIRHKHNSYTCLLCSAVFPTNLKLISHKTNHENEDQSFICHECKLAFSKHCDYMLHKVIHMPYRKEYPCPECKHVSPSRGNYKIHIATHFPKPLTCPICSKVIQGQVNFQVHVRQHSSKFECVECGKIYNNKTDVDRHMSCHTGVKPFQCLYCGKGYSTAAGRLIHTRIHTNEKPFSCGVCDMKFYQPTDLNRHMLRHNNQKTFECEVCNKMFSHKHNLYLHKQSHTKLFACPDCGKKVASVAVLRNHMLINHSTEKPFECAACEQNFATNVQYYKHKKSKVHKRNVFKQTIKKESV